MTAVVITFIVLMVLGMPVAFVMGISGFVFFIGQENLNLSIPVQLTLTQTQNFAILAIPMFIFAGNLMNNTGITEHILRLASVLTGHMRAGLAQTNIMLATLMGGVTSSAIGDVSMNSRIFQPTMEKKNYDRGFAAGTVAFSSIITTMIPPGTGLILYGTLSEVSIGRLFTAGFLPGFLLTFTMMAAVAFTARKHNYPKERETAPTVKEIVKSSIDCFWGLVFPVILIVALRFGFFTPSEAGAFASVYAVVIGLFAYKELTWAKFQDALLTTAYDVGMIMALICFSGALSYALAWEMVPQNIMAFLLSLSASPVGIMAVMMVALLIAGMFIDSTVLILLLTPMLAPVAIEIGVDPVHFGLVMVLTLTVGLLTPPVGICMYIGCNIFKCTIPEFVQGAKYLWLAVVISIFLVLIFPELSLWLPGIVFGR